MSFSHVTCMDSGMTMLVSWSITLVQSEIAEKTIVQILDSQRMCPNDFDDSPFLAFKMTFGVVSNTNIA